MGEKDLKDHPLFVNITASKMSFNRGMNTNSFINRGNLNRRIADSKMNKISNIPFGNTSIIGGSRMDGINPWGNGMSGRGILPSNNNLSLSSSQAQLVAASTLLTNLLRNQQGVQSQVSKRHFHF